MSGTGGCGDDSSANKHPVLLSHYHFPPPVMVPRTPEGGNLHSPSPRQEDGEYRKSETDVNAFFLEQECLHALPQTSARHLAQPTGFVNKSASGLNRGEAVIKLRPEAIAREMSGILTERPGKEISL